MKKSFRLIASLFMLLVVAIALTACSNKKYEQAMTNVSLLLDTTWDQNERLDDDNNSLGSFVNSDFTVPYEINVDGEIIGVSYEISGTGAAVVKNDSAKTVTIDVTQTGEAQKFTLTVTIEKVDPRSWEFNIDALDLSMEKTQAEIDAMNPMTYEEYAAAKSGDSIVIQGYITHPHDYSSSYANGSVWLQDDNGGYYAYRVKVNSQREWDTYFKEGNKIAIVGKKSPYGAWDEVGSGCTYYYIKDAEPKKYDFEDVTSLWGGLKPNSKEAQAVQNKKVTVTAKVASIDEYNSEDMTVGLTVNGQTGYGAYFKDSYLGALPENYLSDLEVGYTIEIEGIVSVTNDGENDVAQICPIDTDCYKITSKEVTDEDRVAAAKVAIINQGIESSYYATMANPFELITSYEASGNKNVSISYELKDVKGNGISLIDGNKLNVEVDGINNVSAKLVANLTCGEASDSYTFNISTKTDKDVMEEIKSQIEKEYDIPAAILAGSLNNIHELPKISTKGATVEYILESNNYIQLKQTLQSKSWYLQVVKDPDLEEPKSLVLTIKVTYDNPNLDTEVLTEVINKTVVVRKEAGSAIEDFYLYTGDGDKIEVEGFVSYKGEFSADYGNFCVYIADPEEGGYYAFRLKGTQETYDALNVGDYIVVTGEKSDDNYGQQINQGATFKEISTDKTYNSDAVDLAGNLANNEWMTLHTADYVTINAKVKEIKTSGFTGKSATIAVLKVGENEIDVAINTYLWNNGTNDSTNAILSKVNTSIVDMDVTVRGYLAEYNDRWQINIVSAEDYIPAEASTEDKLNIEINAIKALFAEAYATSATITLPANGSTNKDVALSYVLDGTYTTVTLEGGKLTINPTNNEEIKIKVTAKLGDVVKEEIITFTVSNKPLTEKTQAEIDAMKPMTYSEYAAAKSGDKILIQGWITHPHDYSSSFANGSVWLQDDNGGYYAYRVKVESQNDWDKYFKVGNKIAISGEKQPYDDWDEVGQGCTYYYITDAETKTFDFVDKTDVLTSNDAKSDPVNALQNQKVKVTGIVTSKDEKFSDKDYNIKLTVGSNVYTVYFKDSYLSFTEEDLAGLTIGDTFTIEGIMTVGDVSKDEKNPDIQARLCPISVDCYKKHESSTETATSVLAKELESLKENLSLIPSGIYNDTEVKEYELYQSTDDRVEISYEVASESVANVATIQNNKVTFANLPVELGNVKIKATIVVTLSSEDTASGNYEIDVMVRQDSLSNWENYHYAAAGDAIEASGVVVASGLNGSKGTAIVQDENGAYLVQNSSAKDWWMTKFVAGHNVTLSGIKDISSSKHVFTVNEDGVTLGEVAAASVVAKDVTSIVQEGKLNPNDHPELEAMYVSVTGEYKVDGNKEYLYVGEERIQYYDDWSFPKINTNFVENGTYKISGYLQRYNSIFEISPLFGDEDIELISIPNSSKINVELETIKTLFESSYTKDETINVYANGKTYEDVVLSYTLEGDYTSVSYTNNVITISPKDDKEEISLKVVASIGEDQSEIVIKFTTQVSTVVEGETVTLKVSCSSNTYMSGENDAANLNLDPEKISIVGIKNGYTQNFPYMHVIDNCVKLYGISGKSGQSLKIDTLDGRNIIKVVINVKANKDGGSISVTGATENIALSTSYQDVVVNYIEGVNSITIHNEATSAIQVWISSIQITYAA